MNELDTIKDRYYEPINDEITSKERTLAEIAQLKSQVKELAEIAQLKSQLKSQMQSELKNSQEILDIEQGDDPIDCEKYFAKYQAEKEKESKIVKFEVLEYSPNLHEKCTNGKFTIGHNYTVLERNTYDNFIQGRNSYTAFSGFRIKVKDDNNFTVWVDEKYFVPSHISLTHDSYCAEQDPELKDNMEILKTLELDIRKVAIEKGIDVNSGLPKTACTSNGLTNEEVLAGISNTNFDGTAIGTGIRTPLDDCLKLSGFPDSDNYLYDNATKCQAAIDRVFHRGRSADPDNILDAIQKNMPRLEITWNNDYLHVDGVATKITYASVQKAYVGIKELASIKTAENTVGRLIANMLKKLF